MPNVNEYEVELKIGQKSGGNERLVTRTEHAYGIMDAMQQAMMHVLPDLARGEEVQALVHIGPPAELILASAFQVKQLIEDAMKGLGKPHK